MENSEKKLSVLLLTLTPLSKKVRLLRIHPDGQ